MVNKCVTTWSDDLTSGSSQCQRTSCYNEMLHRTVAVHCHTRAIIILTSISGSSPRGITALWHKAYANDEGVGGVSSEVKAGQ